MTTQGWLRVTPSGFVHWVFPGVASGLRDTACGRRRRATALTGIYPPRAKRCPKCEAEVFRRDLEGS